MTKHIVYSDLNPLFRPKSVAVVGASDPDRPSGLPLKNLLELGYKGKIYPVNPKRDVVQGLKAYPSLLDIADEVDVAIIVIPAHGVPDVVRQCIEKGVKAAVILVASFAELDEEGKKRQDEIVEIARKSGLIILGPNTNGLVNVHERIPLGYSYAQEVVIPGRLGYVSQSGALLSATVPRFVNRGIGFSYFIGSGNQASLENFDYVKYLLDDPNTDVIAVYSEGIKDPQKFLDVADLALEKKKPIVMMKIGRSKLSAKIAMGHTASLVGSDHVFDAVCKQKGIIRVNDFDNLIAVSSVLLKCKLPNGDRIGVLSTSGGAMGLLADHAEAVGLTNFPDPSPETKKAMLEIMPDYGEIRNPFDMGNAASASARSTPELAKKTVGFFINDENYDIIVAILTPMDRRGTENWIFGIVEAARETDKPVILLSPMGDLREGEAGIFAQGNIPMVIDGAECATAIAGLLRYKQILQRNKEAGVSCEPGISVNIEDVKKSLKSGGRVLSEHESKELLSRFGIPTTLEFVGKSPEEAAQIARKIGYPVVMKVDSPDITHKTDAGGLKLNIRNETEVISAYNEIIANSKNYNPKAEIRGVLIQEMVEDGRETIVGMSSDPQFGPIIVFGLGGVFVEVFKDTSLRVAPITRNDAEEMIKEIKGQKILEAFRGRPEADIEGIINTLLRVSRLSMDLGDIISEIDINPLVVLDKGKGVKAVDALVVLKNLG